MVRAVLSVAYKFATEPGATPQIAGQPFEVAEGLEQSDLKSVVADHCPDVAGPAHIGNEILPKDLDTVEPCLGDGGRFRA